jgi:hypothetical protein
MIITITISDIEGSDNAHLTVTTSEPLEMDTPSTPAIRAAERLALMLAVDDPEEVDGNV